MISIVIFSRKQKNFNREIENGQSNNIEKHLQMRMDRNQKVNYYKKYQLKKKFNKNQIKKVNQMQEITGKLFINQNYNSSTLKKIWKILNLISQIKKQINRNIKNHCQ